MARVKYDSVDREVRRLITVGMSAYIHRAAEDEESRTCVRSERRDLARLAGFGQC